MNQPVLAGWRDGQLYLEVHPPLAEEQHDLVAEADAALDSRARTGRRSRGGRLDRPRGHREDRRRSSAAFRCRCCAASRSLEQYLARARIVENTVPLSPAEETARLVEPPCIAGR